MVRDRHGEARRSPGSGPSTAAGLPQGAPTIPDLRALLPPLLPPPPPPTNEPDRSEPRYFPTCAACQEEAEQGEEWTWFGSRGGCGHGMHPRCWRQYVTHSALNVRRSSGRAGLGFDACGCLRVTCPTCRRAVTGGIELSASSGGQAGRVEQLERLVVPGSEPGDPPTFIPRVAHVAFPEHVDREDGRLRAPALGTDTGTGGGGHGAARAPSRGGAPAEPARAGPPPQAQSDRGGPDPAMARSSAAGGGRAMAGGRHAGGAIGAAVLEDMSGRDAGDRQGGSMRGPGRSHDGGCPLCRNRSNHAWRAAVRRCSVR